LPFAGDPTPLFTATEYVSIGDSPLYQVVAEFIAAGDSLLGQDTAGSLPVAAAAPIAVAPVPPTPVTSTPAPPARVSAPLASVPPAPDDLPSGRHRDGWRVAGHRSPAESGRRSATRSPRHRAA
jgi:hypothetical protein